MPLNQYQKSALLATLAAAVLQCVAASKNPTKKRRCWVRSKKPVTSYSRLLKARHSNFLNGAKYVLGIRSSVFKKLSSYVKEDLTRQDTHMRQSVSALKRLAMTLRYISAGESYSTLSDLTRASTSFLSKSIPENLDTICKNLQSEYLNLPTTQEEWKQISEKFTQRHHFPHCLGLLFTKQTNFKALRTPGVFKLHLLIDAEFNVLYVQSGITPKNIEPDNDFCRNNLFETLEKAKTSFPAEEPVNNGVDLPYALIGNKDYPLRDYILQPYDNPINEVEKNFNDRIAQMRLVADYTFYIIECHFRILTTSLFLKASGLQSIVKACCILHNFSLKNNPDYLDLVNVNSNHPIYVIDSSNEEKIINEQGVEARRKFAEYFYKNLQNGN